jgi:hypothetical protein
MLAARSWLASNELAQPPSSIADTANAIAARDERFNVLTRRRRRRTTEDRRQMKKE